MAKRTQKPTAPPNFIDLRAEALKRNKNLIDDIIRPALANPKLPSVRLTGAVAGLILLAGILGVVTHGHHKATTNPVPKAVQQAVSFPVYYPAVDKLPTGYTYTP